MMLFRSPRPLRRVQPLVLVLLLTGCGGDGGSAPAQVAAATPPMPVHWLDGDYQGEHTPEIGNPDCGFDTAVGYDVRGNVISLRTRKQRRALTGVIDRFGHFSMASADGQHQVVGTISGNMLTATETQPPHHHRHSGNESVPGGVCTAQIGASRVADTAVPDRS